MFYTNSDEILNKPLTADKEKTSNYLLVSVNDVLLQTNQLFKLRNMLEIVER